MIALNRCPSGWVQWSSCQRHSPRSAGTCSPFTRPAQLSDRWIPAKLLRRAAGPELDAIHDRIAELSDSLHALAQALNPPPGVPRMPLQTYYEQAAIIEAERQELHRRMAVTREAALLAEVLSVEWTL